MAEDTDILEPPVAEDQEQPQSPPEQGPGPKAPILKDPDKQKLAQIITKMQSAGESDDNIRGVVKRFQEVNAIQPSSPVDQGTAQTTNKLNQAIQFTGTFQPDLEGEKKGLYLNDPDYQKQRVDFTNRIYTDDKGNLNYPEQDKKGNWSNYYTKQPLPDFDPHSMRGKILQVPKEYQAATNGKQFITPIYNQKTNSYDFPDVETPSVPHMNELSPVTVYGSKGQPKPASYSPIVNAMVGESKKQGGQLDQVLANHPDLAPAIDNTLKKYGDQYVESLNNGSPAITNVIQKSIEDKYGLNIPLPVNIDQKILNSHLNVLNAFDENRANFQDKQNDLQKQADLMADRAKRTGIPITQDDVDRLNQKQQQNIDNWNNYQKSVNFSKNYVNQPEVKDFLDKFQQKQQGLKVLDEVRQRSFPDDTNAAIKQDEYNRKGIEGNLSVWDYLKTAGGRAASGISNLSETFQKMQGLPGPIAEALNAQTQGWIKSNLPQLSPEAIEEMNKGGHGISAILSDLSGTVGSFAPYIIPGMAEEGLGAKAATFATALATSLPEVKQQALDAGLTGKAYNAYLTAKPLVDAAFMTLLPSGKIAKGFEGDVAKAIENGEYNNPKQFIMDMAGKAFKDPNDVAHLQAMLSGTNLGDALTNKFVNSLQAGEDANRGIKRNGDPLSTDISNVFNPKQTATMALAAKVMESVPTILHGSQDYKTLRDVGKTYENARNNMVELAANDLQGTTAKVNEILKTDPSNIYAQHIKATLEDFADAKSKMPDGLSPEQQTALFDIQRKISANNRQAQTTEASYVPHIEKNTEALKKQIPEIIDNHEAALKYLQPAHDELVNNIQSSKTESNETAETDQNRPQAERQQGQIEQPEGAQSQPLAAGNAPSYLLSRHADTIKDEEGKVSGPNQHPLSPDGKKDANDLANEVKEHADKTGVPVTKIVHSGLERAGETAEKVADKTGAKTVSDPKLNTWDIKDFDDVPDEEFKDVQKWFGEHPNEKVYNGPIEKFHDYSVGESLNEYAHRTIDAHAKYENEPVSTLLIDHSNNMMVMDAYRKNGNQWNEQAIHNYLNAEKPEPAILTNKISSNAEAIRSNTGQLPEIGEAVRGSENTGSNDVQQGKTEPSGLAGTKQQTGSGEPSGTASKEKSEDKSEKAKVEDDLPFTEEPGDKSILGTNEGSDEMISTKRSVNDIVRQRMGLPEVPIPKLGSDADEMAKAKTRVDNGKSNPLDIVDKILNTEDINDIGLSTNDRYDMQYHMLQLKQKGLELNKAMHDVTEELDKTPENKKAQENYLSLTQQRAQHADDYIRATTANRIGSAVWGKSGNAMQVELDERGVTLQRIQRISDWYGGKIPADVQKKIDDIQNKLDESDAKMKVLQDKYDQQVLDNEALKAIKTETTKKTRKTSSEYKAERKEIVNDIKDALKKVRGNIGVTIVPGAQELAAIAPHLVKLFKSYAGEGLNKVDAVLDKMVDDIKVHLPGITKNDIKDVLAGKYKETKKPIEKTQAYSEAQQGKANAMLMLRKIEQQAMDSKKNLYMKALDFATQWERRAIFAFNNAVFVKLSSAALLGSTLHKPAEYAVGKLAAKAFPKIADQAIIEGNENLQSLSRFYSEEFDPKKFAQQTWQIYKRGESGLTQELSTKGHVGYTYEKPLDYLRPVLDAYTNTHQVIKDPIKRAVMESSMVNALQWYKAHGMDPSHPLIIEEARQYAYKRAEYEIFQDKNGISSKINSFIGHLEHSGIMEVNEPGLHNKITGNLKYTVSTLYHMLVPIATVPINITRRAAIGAILPYNIIKAYGLEKGIKDIQPEQADILMKQIKKGSIGAFYWTLGLFLVGNAGGLWNRYDPDKKKSGQRNIDLKTNRPHADELRLGSVDIPKGVQHTPQLQALQYGATAADVHTHYVKDLKEPEYKAIGASIMATLAAMVDGVPPAKETQKLLEGIEDPKQLVKVGDDLRRGFGYNKLQDAGILPADSPKVPKSQHQRQHR